MAESNPGLVNVQTATGWSALHLAAENNHGDVHTVRVLLNLGADRTAKTDGGRTAAMVATRKDLIRLLDDDAPPAKIRKTQHDTGCTFSCMKRPMKNVRIIHMSDTHCIGGVSCIEEYLEKFLEKLPDKGTVKTVLVVTGDFTNCGSRSQIKSFNKAVGVLKKLRKIDLAIVTLGNHEVLYGSSTYKFPWTDVVHDDRNKTCLTDDEPEHHQHRLREYKLLLSNVDHVLLHEQVNIWGLNFYGMPWWAGRDHNYQLRWANISDENDDNDCLSRIPKNIDVCMMHGEPRVEEPIKGWKKARDALMIAQPALCLCGHHHEFACYDQVSHIGKTKVVNSALDWQKQGFGRPPHCIAATRRDNGWTFDVTKMW